MYAASRLPGDRPGIRRFVPWLLAVLVLAPSAAIRGVEHHFDGLIDLRFVRSDADWVWLDRGLDKSRFSDADALVFGRALVEYRGRWAKILEARVSLAAFDTVDRSIDLTEAYLLLQPVPRSSWRFRGKAGAFFPPVSLENTDVAWTSPYTLSTSAINTWIGEEFRTIGLEGDVTLLGRFRGSRHDFGLTAGLYQANDPAGSLLSWRGWSLHDRVTGLFSRLPLPDLPVFEPGGGFSHQDPYDEPFLEIDGRVGYYAGLQWDYLQRSRLRLLHYDNLADPVGIKGGQYSWRTEFDSLGWHFKPMARTDLITQAMEGSTLMGRRPERMVYVNYRSAFVLASHHWSAHRVSLRFDIFEVTDEDATPDDPNQEEGLAVTGAYFFEPREQTLRWGRWRLGVELLVMDSDRPARLLFARPPGVKETQLQVSAQWRF